MFDANGAGRARVSLLKAQLFVWHGNRLASAIEGTMKIT
jgi:hypothetical protein